MPTLGTVQTLAGTFLAARRDESGTVTYVNSEGRELVAHPALADTFEPSEVAQSISQSGGMVLPGGLPLWAAGRPGSGKTRGPIDDVERLVRQDPEPYRAILDRGRKVGVYLSITTDPMASTEQED